MNKEYFLRMIQDEMELLTKQWESIAYQPPSKIESIYGLPSAYERAQERLECKLITLDALYNKVNKSESR